MKEKLPFDIAARVINEIDMGAMQSNNKCEEKTKEEIINTKFPHIPQIIQKLADRRVQSAKNRLLTNQ